jgi:hypothetical protein
MAERITISNYDVLADPPSGIHDGKLGDYQLESYRSHVGNNRLQVFLTLYSQAYVGAHQRGDTNECNSIVDKIVNTVCQQCVPPGRFLVNANANQGVGEGGGNPVWQQMEERTVKKLIHAILKPTPGLDSAEIGLNSSSTTTTAILNSSIASDSQKRRRRSSLLRRSASDGMIGIDQDGKKKVSKLPGECSKGTREESTWSSSRGTKKDCAIVSLNRMDVILTSSRDALDPNSQSVGNNRLHILVAMQSGKYHHATVDGREAILDEVVQTVNTFWKGRFLTESSKGYDLLSKEDARNALRSIFDMRSGQNLLSKGQNVDLMMPDHNHAHSVSLEGVTTVSQFGPNLQRNLSKQASESTLRETTGKFPTTNSMSITRQVSTSALPTGRTNFFANNATLGVPRQVSTSTIASLPVPLPSDVDDLRWAAVQSLQKQKARQNIAIRLENASRRGNHLVSLNPVAENVDPTTDARDTIPMDIPRTGRNLPQFSVMSEHSKKRQSTVFSKLDPSVMEQLVADFDDADCNDDD